VRHKAAPPRAETPVTVVSPDSRSPLPAAAHVPANEPAPAATTHAAAVHGAKAAQDEFTFGELESRGQFDKTDRNLFEGQDLDVPTYLRKGIKIVL
jgi:cell division protein FtsZ